MPECLEAVTIMRLGEVGNCIGARRNHREGVQVRVRRVVVFLDLPHVYL